MININIRELGFAFAVVCLVAAGVSAPTRADDTEIFRTSFGAATTGRPKVLILFDNSGSMGFIVPGQRPPMIPTMQPMTTCTPLEGFIFLPMDNRQTQVPAIISTSRATVAPSPLPGWPTRAW